MSQCAHWCDNLKSGFSILDCHGDKSPRNDNPSIFFAKNKIPRRYLLPLTYYLLPQKKEGIGRFGVCASPFTDALASSFFLHIGNRYATAYKQEGKQVIELPNIFSPDEPTEYGGKQGL